MKVRLSLDFGLDLTENPKENLENILKRSGNISSGFQALDHVVGKYSQGDLIFFVGGSGSGKSLFLMNTAIYGMEQNLNVMYITLELNPELCARRMYSMITKMSQKELYVNLQTTEGLVKKFETSTGGKTQIKYMPSGTKVSEIAAFCEEFMITTGKKIDILCIDYLDLVDPSRSLSKSANVFDKDKAVSEEIRNFGQEHGITIVSAAQAGRSAVGVEDLDHSHISGGISKINTADLVLGIITSNAMRERGQYQLQIMKTRNSAGTGRKVDLKVSEMCMKISDDPDFLQNLANYMANPVKAPNPSTMTNAERLFTEVQNEINKQDPTYKEVKLDVEEKMINDIGLDDDELDKLNRLLKNNNNLK
jgi:replicative DNA helicase